MYKFWLYLKETQQKNDMTDDEKQHKWLDEYYNKEIVDLRKHLSDDEFKILKNLEIDVKDKILTEYEFETLNMLLLDYYENKKLELKNVKQEEYKKLLQKFEEICGIYEF